MSLYRIVEVPDPNGVLADLIEELLDNSALVEVKLDYEASHKRYMDGPVRVDEDGWFTLTDYTKAIVDVAYGTEDE